VLVHLLVLLVSSRLRALCPVHSSSTKGENSSTDGDRSSTEGENSSIDGDGSSTKGENSSIDGDGSAD
jgi:hypothetical protein